MLNTPLLPEALVVAADPELPVPVPEPPSRVDPGVNGIDGLM